MRGEPPSLQGRRWQRRGEKVDVVSDINGIAPRAWTPS
jgi:hypothetical protein